MLTQLARGLSLVEKSSQNRGVFINPSIHWSDQKKGYAHPSSTASSRFGVTKIRRRVHAMKGMRPILFLGMGQSGITDILRFRRTKSYISANISTEL